MNIDLLIAVALVVAAFATGLVILALSSKDHTPQAVLHGERHWPG